VAATEHLCNIFEWGREVKPVGNHCINPLTPSTKRFSRLCYTPIKTYLGKSKSS